jgi:hypothetical protein
MDFEIITPVRAAHTIAVGRQIREINRLVRAYGKGRWRKRTGEATVRLPDGTTRKAQLHWYEATGIGKKEFKIKRYVEP